jgi:hypothetical protein
MLTGQLDNQIFWFLYRLGGLARGRVYFDRAPIPCGSMECLRIIFMIFVMIFIMEKIHFPFMVVFYSVRPFWAVFGRFWPL